MTMDKTYQIVKGRLLLIYSMTLIALNTSFWAFYIGLTSNSLAWMIIGIVSLGFYLVIPFLAVTKMMTSITHITLVTLFANQELLITDIAGYRIKQLRKSARIILVLVSGLEKTIPVHYLRLKDHGEMLAWLQQNFTNLTFNKQPYQ